MSTSENDIIKTTEFIENAQEIIDRTNDLMAAINKLTGRSAGENNLDAKQLAQHARMEEDLAALVQRYFPDSPGGSGNPTAEINPSTSQNPGAVRPGRFRTRI